METKICLKCKVDKPIADFGKDKYGPAGLNRRCKRCGSLATQDYYRRHKSQRQEISRKTYWENRDPILKQKKERRAKLTPEEKRKQDRTHKLKQLYGLTMSEVETLKERQNHQCAICDSPAALHIDHCHKTGKVRGLLCKLCNTGIGSLKENAEILERARDYILSNGIL